MAERGIGWLGEGIERLRPDDHFMILMETESSPMHVGAFVELEGSGAGAAHDADRLVECLLSRLPSTPLLVAHREAPEGFDSDVWLERTTCDEAYHFVRRREQFDDASIRQAIADLAVERLDLSRAPFRFWIFENLSSGNVAFYLKVHHSLCDGIGFQHVLGLFHDQTPGVIRDRIDAQPPAAEQWIAKARERFEEFETTAEERRARRKQAIGVLKSGALPERPLTPTLGLSGPVSATRHYATVSFELSGFKNIAKSVKGTVNDLFLAVLSTALRRYLLSVLDLPSDPLVVNASRSYRKVEEHGLFGNRIVAIHPHLATNLADPIERLRAIQLSMASELERSPYDEELLDAPEEPFGARDRRERFSKRAEAGVGALPGNVTISNVPGPEEERSIAGLRQVANYPVPILGTGRFLNCTMRRNGPRLDLGVMVDAAKIDDPSLITGYISDALLEYDRLGTS